MTRPENILPPELFYNDDEALKYTNKFLNFNLVHASSKLSMNLLRDVFKFLQYQKASML